MLADGKPNEQLITGIILELVLGSANAFLFGQLVNLKAKSPYLQTLPLQLNSKKGKMGRIDISLGCVIYSEVGDGIEAEWLYQRNDKIEKGIGKAKRRTKLNPERRFEGEFEITYFDSEGTNSPLLNLDISFEDDYYLLVWRMNGETTDVGIGMESGGKLSVSYTKAT